MKKCNSSFFSVIVIIIHWASASVYFRRVLSFVARSFLHCSSYLTWSPSENTICIWVYLVALKLINISYVYIITIHGKDEYTFYRYNVFFSRIPLNPSIVLPQILRSTEDALQDDLRLPQNDISWDCCFRLQCGPAGRQKVFAEYSVCPNNYLPLFRFLLFSFVDNCCLHIIMGIYNIQKKISGVLLILLIYSQREMLLLITYWCFPIDALRYLFLEHGRGDRMIIVLGIWWILVQWTIITPLYTSYLCSQSSKLKCEPTIRMRITE